MPHELQIVEIHTEDTLTVIKLRCPQCPETALGIERWGPDADHRALVAEAQRQHQISVAYRGRWGADMNATAHYVDVVPARDSRKGLHQAVCSCGFTGPVEFESRAQRTAATHHTAATQNS